MISRRLALMMFALCLVIGAAAGLVISGLADTAENRMSMFIGFALVVVVGAVISGSRKT